MKALKPSTSLGPGATMPIIRFLLDDPVYDTCYPALLEENSRSVR